MHAPRCLASLQCGAAAGPCLGEIWRLSWPEVGDLCRYQLEVWKVVPRGTFAVVLAVVLLGEAHSLCKFM